MYFLWQHHTNPRTSGNLLPNQVKEGPSRPFSVHLTLLGPCRCLEWRIKIPQVLVLPEAHIRPHIYSRLQNRCPRGPENLRAAAGCQTGAHGHFPTKNSPSPFHITRPQTLKSFSEPYITEISTFYASILIFCSSH